MPPPDAPLAATPSAAAQADSAPSTLPVVDLLLSAGEASGDMYAARLATALRSGSAGRFDIRMFGMGGPKMRAAGVETVVDSTELALVGFVEVFRKLPALLRAWRRLMNETRRRRPAFSVLTDFPGFHLRLARALQRQGIRNIYFVCPQFWAWRPGRVKFVRRRFVRGLCIFPFEVEFYRRGGVPVDWIGHPLVDRVRPTMTRAEFVARHGLDPDPARPIVALLPGSRSSELRQHLPRLGEAVDLLRKPSRPPNKKPPAAAGGERQFVLALAPGMTRKHVEPYMRPGLPIAIVENATYDALGAADVAIVSSGTATVETALIGVPMVVVYRVARLTARIARRLVKTPFFAMVNLIADKRVVPELIQDDFTPQRVAEEVERLLDSPKAREQMKRDLAAVRKKLGPPGAIDRAAAIILAEITAALPTSATPKP